MEGRCGVLTHVQLRRGVFVFDFGVLQGFLIKHRNQSPPVGPQFPSRWRRLFLPPLPYRGTINWAFPEWVGELLQWSASQGSTDEDGAVNDGVPRWLALSLAKVKVV